MSCRHLGQRRAEIGYDPETATVVLSPSWGPTPQPLGLAPQPMLGLEFLEARSRLFQDGMGLGPVKASGARPRPTPRRRAQSGPEGEDDHQGRESQVRDRTDRPQKPEGSASKT